ncbi:MAG: alpha/beta hydrolase [Pseudomonadota bacterium]
MARDWDDEFANMAHIPGSAAFPDQWAQAAAAFRQSNAAIPTVPYGAHPREKLDLFLPSGAAKGLLVFVHGGYWLATGREDWSHLAAGALALGFAVALPSYPLAPEARITAITQSVARAIAAAAALVEGPIYLAGHSAGGHLAMRMVSDEGPLPPTIRAQLARVTGISGVYDLRPLRNTKMNATLQLSKAEAAAESPILLKPYTELPLTLWVGSDERPEFLRQSRALHADWVAKGAEITLVEEPGHHHFSILDGLTQPESPLMAAILRAP